MVLLLITLISILVISLTHTGLLFYSQYLVFLYFVISLSRNKKISFSEILIIAIYLLVLFLFLSSSESSKLQVLEICNSIKDFVKNDCVNRGQFFWLYRPMTEYFDVKLIRSDVNLIKEQRVKINKGPFIFKKGTVNKMSYNKVIISIESININLALNKSSVVAA